jgi:tetratricopeptide (TPR) repeat protein
MIGSVVAGLVSVTAIGSGYWYYLKQQAEKAIAAERQRQADESRAIAAKMQQEAEGARRRAQEEREQRLRLEAQQRTQQEAEQRARLEGQSGISRAAGQATNPTSAVLAMINAAKNGNTDAVLAAKSVVDAFPKPARGDRKVARERNNLGLAGLKANDYRTAVAHFSDGVSADPSDVEITNNLGYALMMADRLQDARKTLIEALALDSGRAGAWANLGQTLAKQGDDSSAVAAFINAFTFSRAQNKTIEFLTNLSQSDPDSRIRSVVARALQTPQIRDATTSGSRPDALHYIVGLDPKGDNWLALRSEPGFNRGVRLRQLGPETLMRVTNRSGEWAQVQLQTGEIGWVYSKYIACCK